MKRPGILMNRGMRRKKAVLRHNQYSLLISEALLLFVPFVFPVTFLYLPVSAQ